MNSMSRFISANVLMLACLGAGESSAEVVITGTRVIYKIAAEKHQLGEMEKQLCPSVKNMLAIISRGIKTTDLPVGQKPITN